MSSLPFLKTDPKLCLRCNFGFSKDLHIDPLLPTVKPAVDLLETLDHLWLCNYYKLCSWITRVDIGNLPASHYHGWTLNWYPIKYCCWFPRYTRNPSEQLNWPWEVFAVDDFNLSFRTRLLSASSFNQPSMSHFVWTDDNKRILNEEDILTV